MTKRSHLYLAISSISLSLALGAGSANAQRQISGQLEEVVVTAQKREQNLQDVPISVSALDAAMIEKTFARDITDIAGMVPNLGIDPILSNGTASISIRGMQLNDVEKSFDPAVAVYQDGVYLATTTGALLNVWDAERIEVLRGPQGTMFGRNTIGGVVHVIRSKPTGELGGKFAVTVAEDDQRDIKGTLNLPAFANISTKVTYMDMSGGGYFDNKTRGEDEGETDLTMWSVSALWEPSDNFSLQVTYDDIDDKTPVRPVTCLTESPELFALIGLVGDNCAPVSNEDFHRTTYTSTNQSANVDLESITINAEWQVSDAHKLVALVATRDMQETSNQEFDGIAFDAFRVSRPQYEEQLSYELRLESDFDNIRTTLGGFLWDSEYTAWQNTYFFGGFNDSPWTKQETSNYALFGQVDWDVTDKITLTLGGRYTDEEKEFCQVFTTLSDSPTVSDFDGLPKVATRGWGNSGTCPDWGQGVINNNYTDPVTGQASVFTGKESWSEFTPKVGITYNLENGIAYASYTEGFRSGGFNGRATSAGNAGPYDPELVESIELGFKTSWFDNTLQFNAALFSTDYKDKQEDVVLPGTDGAVTLTLVQNAAGATMDGLEIETVWLPTAGLTLTANIGYLDAEYDQYSVPGPDGNLVDKSGFDLRKAPELTYSVGANWEVEVASDVFVVTNVNYRYRDDYAVNASSNGGPKHYSVDPLMQDGFGLLDASINLETENWRLSIFGKNLTDESYMYHVLDVAAGFSATSATDPSPVYTPGLWTFGTMNRPRYFGAELQYQF
ncbi:MAG: Pesticin receptor precursor [Pseudomonadota bacterium]